MSNDERHLTDADATALAAAIEQNDPAARLREARRSMTERIRGEVARRRSEREASIRGRLFDRRLGEREVGAGEQ
jgi:hypothetical protein